MSQRFLIGKNLRQNIIELSTLPMKGVFCYCATEKCCFSRFFYQK